MADAIPEASRTLVKQREKFRCARCGGPAMRGEWHHRRSRSVHDEWTHDPSNGLWLSAACHRYVHANVLESRRAGLIVSRYEPIPMNLPVKRWDGWMLLSPDGTVSATTELDCEREETAAVRQMFE